GGRSPEHLPRLHGHEPERDAHETEHAESVCGERPELVHLHGLHAEPAEEDAEERRGAGRGPEDDRLAQRDDEQWQRADEERGPDEPEWRDVWGEREREVMPVGLACGIAASVAAEEERKRDRG